MTGIAPTLSRVHLARTAVPKLALVLLIAVMAGGEPAAAASLLSGGDRTRYKQAFKAAAKGYWRQARRIARRGKDSLPRKILTWRAMTQRDAHFDFADVTRFIAANPDWPYQRTLRRNAERAISETTKPEAILAFFAGREPRTADGMIAFGETLIETDRTEDGEKWLRRAWREGRFSRRNESRFLRRYRKLFNKQDHWARLDGLLWNGRFREARRMLRRVSPAHKALAIARLRLRRFRGGVDGAINRVPDGLRNHPGLLYERMRWRRRKGRDQGALDILQAAPAELGRPDLWARERMIVARRLLADGRITDAYRITRDHRVPPEKRASFAEIEWLAGWIALRWLNEADEALERFERVHDVVRYPVSKARAAYWAGRAAQAMGRHEKSKQWFLRAAAHGATYHGQLAQASDRKPPPAKSILAPTQAELKKFNAHELVRAVHMLNQLGQTRWIRPFIRRLGRLEQTPSHKRQVARLAYGIRRDDLAVWVSRDAQRDGVPLYTLGYPLVRMREGRPERALLLALARQESNFDRKAISPAGARGIMQLMPRTARHVARSLRVRYSRQRLTRDSAYNVRLGRAYLRRMLDRFDSSYLLAIGAYNAGPNAVRRWIRAHGDPREAGIDPIDWIEMIPYEETRTYVQRVLGNLQVYRTRLRPGQVATTLANDLQR
ncbi:MAG: lytic transglycosylase domain-containing protein [Alphaproteobacteria bacterium]